MPIKPPDKGLVRVGRIPAGIDNMARDPNMERDRNGALIAVREAENVDIDNDGGTSRRRGYTKIDATMHHSAFAAPDWPFGLVVRGTHLCAFTADETIQLVSGMTPWDEVTCAVLGTRIFWSNKFRSGVINEHMQALPFGVAVPDPPTVTATAVGACAGGIYQVATTWQRDDGEESGAYEAFDLEVPDGGGIQLSDIPQPEDTTITRCNIYVSKMGGKLLYRSTSIPVGITEYLVGPNPSGKELDTLLLEPVPPASIYRMFNGRLLWANDREFGWSEPHRPTLTNIVKNRIRFSGTIDMVEPITQDEAAGVWVAAQARTWFLAGQDPTAENNSWAMRGKHPYGVVPGSSRVVSAAAFNPEASGNLAFWLDTAGHWCTGSAGGVIARRAEGRFNAGVPDRAACFFRERGGMKHIVTAMQGAVVDRFSMSDSMSIRVMRNGVEVQL